MTIVPRDGLDPTNAQPILAAISAVPWADLQDAYGAAEDVGDQLAAVVVGDDETREAAWWNLWGNIHHQGTIYSATVPAVPILARLIAWREFPDRTETLAFLRAVADAEGVVVWARGSGEEIDYDTDAQSALTDELRLCIDETVPALLEAWPGESERVRRALLWLLGALPRFEERFAPLIEATLPAEFGSAWALVRRGAKSQDEFDEICAFEAWTLADPDERSPRLG